MTDGRYEVDSEAIPQSRWNGQYGRPDWAKRRIAFPQPPLGLGGCFAEGATEPRELPASDTSMLSIISSEFVVFLPVLVTEIH